MDEARIVLVAGCLPNDESLYLLSELKEKNFEVVLVLNGPATDDFSARAKSLGAMLCCGLEGETVALRSSLNYIKETYAPPFSVVIVPSPKGYSVSDIEKMFAQISRHPHGFVVSYSKIENRRIFLRAKTYILKFLYRHFTGAEILGNQSSLKGFSDRLISQFEMLPDNSYEYHINMLIRCRQQGLPVFETEIHHTPPVLKLPLKSAIKSIYARHKNIVKFSLSSFTAFLVDYSLFSALMSYSRTHINIISLTFANVFARLVSSTINFTVNRKLVFKSNTGLLKSATQFYTLAAVILAGNSVLLNFFANGLGINHYLAKIMTELIFFLFNWTIQSLVIFRNKKS